MSVMSIDDYMIVNKRILKIVGLYPINYLRYSACLFSMLLMVVPQISQLYLDRGDFSVILETSSVLSTLMLAILKTLVWIWNPEIPLLVEYMMTDYWTTAQLFDDDNHMHRYAESGRNMTRGYCFLIANALMVFFTVQPVKLVVEKLRKNVDGASEKSFPFPAVYPECCYYSPFYEVIYVYEVTFVYELACASQIIATSTCGLVVIAIDGLIASALFHTSGHFKIIRENLLNLDRYFDLIEHAEEMEIRKKSEYSKAISRLVRKRLASFVDHHSIVTRFSDDMENAFNPIMFLQVFASSLIICLVGFQVTSTSENDRLVEYSSYLVMALFQILLFCWPGGQMLLESTMIGQAAYSMNWYKASCDVKVEVYLIILRSQKPCYLTAGKLYAMSMQSFGGILNSSLSYFTLLRSINSD